jgi:hypothetical protein
VAVPAHHEVTSAGVHNPLAVPLHGVGGVRRLRQVTVAELRPASNTSLCLDTPGNNFSGGQQMALDPCDGAYTQSYVMPIPGVDWRVRVGGLMVCMEVESNGTTAGAKVVVSKLRISSCWGGRSRAFTQRPPLQHNMSRGPAVQGAAC